MWLRHSAFGFVVAVVSPVATAAPAGERTVMLASTASTEQSGRGGEPLVLA